MRKNLWQNYVLLQKVFFLCCILIWFLFSFVNIELFVGLFVNAGLGSENAVKNSMETKRWRAKFCDLFQVVWVLENDECLMKNSPSIDQAPRLEFFRAFLGILRNFENFFNIRVQFGIKGLWNVIGRLFFIHKTAYTLVVLIFTESDDFRHMFPIATLSQPLQRHSSI